jgi:hypothetical protein
VSYSVRGEEPVVIGVLKVGALFKGSNNPRYGVSKFSESPQGICRPKEWYRGKR